MWHKEHGAFPWYCNGALCPKERCQAQFWHARIKLLECLIEEYDLWNFFTLTLDPNTVPRPPMISKEGYAWDYLPYIWNKMTQRFNRMYRDYNQVNGYLFDFKYAAITEYNPTTAKETGEYWPHIHGFCNELIPQETLSWMWYECGGGLIVDIRKVSGEMGEYVSKQLGKYVGKQNLLEAYKRRGSHRTLWRTRGMKAEFELTKQEGWVIVKNPSEKQRRDAYGQR